MEMPSCTAYQLSGCMGTCLPGTKFIPGVAGGGCSLCDANGLGGIRNLLPSSCMSYLSAPGGQLGPGCVALHSRLWNNAIRWFRSQKPHSADQQRRVPGAHAALRCVPGEGQRSGGSVQVTCPSSRFLLLFSVCKESPAFPLSFLHVFASWQSWFVRRLHPNLPK